jgi:hypothetical protein
MRTLGTFPSLRSSRNPLAAVGIMVVVLYAAYKAAELILTGDLSTFGLVAFISIGLAVAVAILNDWRRGLYVLVAWILFEDFVRKFLGNNMLIYFGKDILALIVYLSFFRARRAQGFEAFRIPFRVPLLIFIWFCILQIFNPASTSIFYGILGAKVDFIYIPLIYVGYALIQSEEDLRRLFSFTCILILAVASLGLAQSIIGPTFLNPATLQEDIRELSTTYRVAPISGLMAYRPTSVFVSAGRFMDFLVVSWVLSLGFGGYLLLRTKRGRFLAFATIGVVAAASLMSASRGVFMWNTGIALLFIAGFLWGAPWRQREALRVMRAIQRTLLMIGMGVLLLMTVFPQELGSRLAIYSETLLPSSPTSELVHRTQTYPLKQLEFAFDHPRWPYGYGLGTCTLGRQYVIRIMHAAPMVIGVESGFGNLIVELGILGPLLWIILGLSIAFSAWKVVSDLRGSPWFPLAFIIWLFAVLIFFPVEFVSSAGFQDFVTNSYFWLFLGVLYRLRDFPRSVLSAQPEPALRQG